MKELTPEHLRCFSGACPAVFDVTPEHLKCLVSQCPSVSKIGDGQQLLIIGKVPSVEQMAQIEGRVGPGELAIVILAEYFPGLRGDNAPKPKYCGDCGTRLFTPDDGCEHCQ